MIPEVSGEFHIQGSAARKAVAVGAKSSKSEVGAKVTAVNFPDIPGQTKTTKNYLIPVP